MLLQQGPFASIYDLKHHLQSFIFTWN